MRQRAANEQAARAVIEQRIQQIETEITGAEEKSRSSARQIASIDKELPGLRDLLKKGLVALSRVTALERQREDFAAQLSAAQNSATKGREQVNEQQAVLRAREEAFKSVIATELLAARKQLTELRTKLRIATDRDSRIEIKAPLAGIVQGMTATTIGAVVQPGATVLEISPVSTSLIVRVKVAPRDAETVHVGQNAQLRLTGFQDNEVPIIYGTVRRMSNDVVVDADSRLPFFESEINVDLTMLPEAVRNRLRPGLPVEAIIATGENTVLGYLVDPLLFRLRASMNEE
jgi:HlyD family type I secretion membrane fusion protein